MGKCWNFCKKYLLNIDAIAAIFIAGLVIYFIFTTKRKKYKFNLNAMSSGINGTDENEYSIPIKKKKKKNKHEEECRRIFESIFGVKFKSVRPSWLRNPATGKNLELDGFNAGIRTPKGMGLAFEYDGIQHSELNSHFHKNGVDEFEYQITKDSWKNKKCKDQGVLLIRIPHFVAYHDLDRYIKNILKREGMNTQHNYNSSVKYNNNRYYQFGRNENDNIALTGGRLYD